MTERYLTCAEAGDIARESADTIRRRCKAGQIQAVKLGGSWRISESELTRFLSPGLHGSPRKRLTAKQEQQLGVTA